MFARREWVYVIEAVGTSNVKIGVSGDVDKRMAAIATTVPFELRLLHREPGDRALEQELHERFAEYRVRGEWFERRGWFAVWLDTLVLVRRAWGEQLDILCPATAL